MATLLGVVVLLDMRNQQTVAQDFLKSGVATVADGVELTVSYGKGGSYIDTVEVTFVAGTDRHVATLSNSLGDPEGNTDGRHPPAAGTRYAAPLRVLYKSGDPSQVMAVTDAEDFTADTAAPSVISGVVAVAGTTTVAVTASMLAYARLQSGAAHRSASRRRRDRRPDCSGRHRRAGR